MTLDLVNLWVQFQISLKKMQIIADKKQLVIIKNNRLSRWKQLFVLNSLHQFSARSLLLLVLVLTCGKTNKNTNTVVWGNVAGNHKQTQELKRIIFTFTKLNNHPFYPVKITGKTIFHTKNCFCPSWLCIQSSTITINEIFFKLLKNRVKIYILRTLYIFFLIYSISFIKHLSFLTICLMWNLKPLTERSQKNNSVCVIKHQAHASPKSTSVQVVKVNVYLLLKQTNQRHSTLLNCC